MERHRRDCGRKDEVAAGRWRRLRRLAPLAARRVKGAAIVSDGAVEEKVGGEGVGSRSPAQWQVVSAVSMMLSR